MEQNKYGAAITYEYEQNLYINMTNQCCNSCDFCLRNNSAGSLYADNLWYQNGEPTKEEIWEELCRYDLNRFHELVFCGYGEPTFRWDDIAWVCDQLRDAGPVPPIRMDTNGHGNVICGRDITPELKGRIDVVSISLNWSDQAGYDKIVHPDFPQAFQAMQDFTRRAVAAGVKVVMTVVDCMDEAEIARCRKLCQSLGATFRVRVYSTDWQ